ncbi:MAG: site-2 protease family protein [Parcubacteria group bacterium]|nr:site-2 protease family protein [Parcubacteria group bacterium]
MPNQVIFFLYPLIVLLFSVILHEVSHGFSAKLQGDNTAETAGRLTLNPLPHLDPFGSIILPLLLAIPAFFGAPSFIIGWAKPVPFNPNNLKNKRWGPALVALAGPLTNIILAMIFGILIRFSYLIPALPPSFDMFLSYIVLINLLLAIFNLMPIPPLDGSKILFSALPRRWHNFETLLERQGFILILIFIFFGFSLILPVIFSLFNLIAGRQFGF